MFKKLASRVCSEVRRRMEHADPIYTDDHENLWIDMGYDVAEGDGDDCSDQISDFARAMIAQCIYAMPREVLTGLWLHVTEAGQVRLEELRSGLSTLKFIWRDADEDEATIQYDYDQIEAALLSRLREKAEKSYMRWSEHHEW